MTRSRLHAAIFCAAWGASAVAIGQQTADQATVQQRYDRAVADCNDANLPRPERDACVRDAGRALDRACRGLAPDVDVVSPDGRSTVIIPDDAPPPQGKDQTVISPDGRSTIVLPAGGDRPMPQ